MYIGLHANTRQSCPIIMKLEFSRQISEKYSNIKFHDNPSSGGRFVPCAQTDRHEEANSHLSQFCESAKNAGCRLFSELLTAVLKTQDNILSGSGVLSTQLNNSTTNVITLLCSKDLDRHYKFPISTVLLTFKSGVHKFRATKSFTVAPNICGSSEWNLLHVTLLIP